MNMNLNLALSMVSLILFLLFYFLTRRNKFFLNLKKTMPFLFSISVLSGVLYFFNTEFITKYFNPSEFNYILGLVLVIFILIAAIKIIVFVIFDFFIHHKFNIKIIKLFKDIFIIILYIAGILIIFNSYLNIKVTAILATSAVLTVVVGFALQDILGDIFSGIALNFEDSLKIGDWIKIGDMEGKIEQLRWRAVKIRTVDNVLILVPNQVASKKEIKNFKDKFALRLQIGLSYKNSPDLIIRVIKETLEKIEPILKKPKPEVFVLSFDDFAINYEIQYWIKDASKKNIIESEIRRKTWYAFKRNNIQIPFPIRDIYIKKEMKSELSFEEIIEKLSNNEILKLMDKEQLKTLLSNYKIELFGKDDMIIKNGDIGEYFYYVFDGEVDIIKDNTVLNTLKKDDYFGEMSVLTGNKANADVIASRESSILKISSNKFKEIIEMNEELAKKIAEVIAIRKIGLSRVKKTRNDKLEIKIDKESKTIFNRIKKYFSI